MYIGSQTLQAKLLAQLIRIAGISADNRFGQMGFGAGMVWVMGIAVSSQYHDRMYTRKDDSYLFAWECLLGQNKFEGPCLHQLTHRNVIR